MQISFSAHILRLGRDHLQSLSIFYNGVQQLEHFEDVNSTILTHEKAQRDQNLGKKSSKRFVKAT